MLLVIFFLIDVGLLIQQNVCFYFSGKGKWIWGKEEKTNDKSKRKIPDPLLSPVCKETERKENEEE